MKRILIFIVAYNAERHIASVLERIPASVWDNPDYQADAIVIDDFSKDQTVAVARAKAAELGRPVRVFRTPRNQGYGGNQKLGYSFAIEQDYDAAVLLHGDGQYAPECLPEMIAPLVSGEAEVVFGSRMMEKRNALKGGMPYYKFVGNQILTWVQNRMMGVRMTEFHSGYRAYSTAALKRIPFRRNSDWFDFDTDIIIQLIDSRIPIKEIPIPTHYGDEVCHVNGLKYAGAILNACVQSRMQRKGIFYTRKFDYEGEGHHPYRDKVSFDSSHSFAVDRVSAGARVLDIGDMPGHVGAALAAKGCEVHGIDMFPPDKPEVFATFAQLDLNHLTSPKQLPKGPLDTLLLLDVIEHMPDPERVMDVLAAYMREQQATLILTTPNIGFFSVRLMLLLGWFQYGKAGILDRTHTRLFTFRSLRHLAEQSGFAILETRGIPAPFPLALPSPDRAARMLRFNRWLIGISKGLFSYQIGMVLQARPELAHTFAQTMDSEHIS